MINDQKVVVVMPAYNAEKTLEKTISSIPKGYVDELILVDDASTDETTQVSKALGISTITHPKNRGYGGNQKTCYDNALQQGADIVIMLHPDYQYEPTLIPTIASMIAFGPYDVVLASRILGKGALVGGMPLYKYIANRFLTLTENLLVSEKLTEYHTGYRAFHRRVLEKIPYHRNSDDFVFDNQMLVQVMQGGFEIGEISCPTKYFTDASSINFRRSCQYGIGVLKTACQYRLQKMGLTKFHYLDF
ncbi:MAG: glycosyl transferase family 2 [Deltaproteobacteria bacterium CG11_big_fil_rev_8_21_14_0_20_47_16]|nr:MAG: glycosyl transferase family 2 [Deltaproteobacteria bacterium CG11_big_fil_rev_8_21_14_0_20_47_16]